MLHKFYNLVHSLHLEAGCWSLVEKMASAGVTMTTDWGTEAGLNQIPGFQKLQVDQMFPHLVEIIEDEAM